MLTNLISLEKVEASLKTLIKKRAGTEYNVAVVTRRNCISTPIRLRKRVTEKKLSIPIDAQHKRSVQINKYNKKESNLCAAWFRLNDSLYFQG